MSQKIEKYNVGDWVQVTYGEIRRISEIGDVLFEDQFKVIRDIDDIHRKLTLLDIKVNFKNGICGKVRRNTAYSDRDVIDVIPDNAIKQGSVIMATIFVDYLDDEMYTTIKLLLKDIDQYIKDNPEHGEVA